MNFRHFGRTGLIISEIGFGSWAIGGPASVGGIPIGWGNLDAQESINSIRKALELGINFFDTADFYGLGQSEQLLGSELHNKNQVIIATKVGHRISADNNIYTDYSKEYIIQACEASLRRLRRDTIDYYQLHTGKIKDLEKGGCLEAMEILKKTGKIRYWGISLHTYQPQAEADYILKHGLGDGLQLVFNIINQRALPIILSAAEKGFGIIARMPLQFGLLTGKFDENSNFPSNDHRSFRLPTSLIRKILPELLPIWKNAEKYQTSKTGMSLSYPLGFSEISTVIPGMKSSAQVVQNVSELVKLTLKDRTEIALLFDKSFGGLVDLMQQVETFA